MTVSLPHFLVVSVLLLAAGIVTMLRHRCAIGIWMGIQLVTTAAALNFAAFNAFLPATPSVPLAPRAGGQLFVLFIIVLAAAQSATALALILNLHHSRRKREQ